MKSFHRMVVLGGTLLPGILWGGEYPDPTAWSHRQSLRVGTPGLVRWSVPPETLGVAAPDHRDLRLLGPDGGEIPYLVDEPRREQEVWEPARAFQSELKDGQTVLNFSPPPGIRVSAIELATPAPQFLKAVRVEARVKGTWKTLAKNQGLFREAWAAENRRIEFSSVEADAFRVAVNDQKSAAIPWTGARLLRPERAAPDADSAPLRILRREEGPSETRLRLELPAPNLFIEDLVVESPDPLFQRSVTLAVERIAPQGDLPTQGITEMPLASSTLFRLALEGFDPQERMSFRVDRTVESREVVLVVRNGDNPPVAVSGVRARFLPVRLVFRATQAGEHRLMVGNPRAGIRNYDLGGLRAELVKGPFRAAESGLLEPNPAHRAPDLLPELPELGAPLDVSPWVHRAPVSLSAAGFHRLELTPAVLAVADESGRDLRLVREGKQLPFLVDRTSVWRSLVPTVKPLGEEKGKSRWELTLAQDRLPVGYLECLVTDPLFQRSVTVYEERSDERGQTYPVNLTQTQWARTGGHGAERRVLFLQGNVVGRRLIVEIDNGDNAPLTLDGFKVHYRTMALVFKASPGAPLWLYYGNPKADWPRYDLSVVSSQVLKADRSEASLGEEERLKGRAWGGQDLKGAAKVVFWVVLGLVVLLLLWVLRSLLPSQPAPPKG